MTWPFENDTSQVADTYEAVWQGIDEEELEAGTRVIVKPRAERQRILQRPESISQQFNCFGISDGV